MPKFLCLLKARLMSNFCSPKDKIVHYYVVSLSTTGNLFLTNQLSLQIQLFYTKNLLNQSRHLDLDTGQSSAVSRDVIGQLEYTQ